MDSYSASANQRDQFLNALDARDIDLCHRLAEDLKNCGNALPGVTCEQLGLPPGSTYGSAARTILTTSWTLGPAPQIAADEPKDGENAGLRSGDPA